MKSLMLVLAAGLAFHPAAGEIIVQRIHGDVSVRHGVAEGWSKVASGDVLRPDDTMKTGEKGAAVLVTSTPREEDHRTPPGCHRRHVRYPGSFPGRSHVEADDGEGAGIVVPVEE